jgi:two-component system response regulator HydG
MVPDVHGNGGTALGVNCTAFHPARCFEKDSVTEELTGRILIVDDDPYFLRILSRILSGENFQVKTAEGATQAAQVLKENSFDVVISDLRLPDGDGLSVLQELRKAGSEVPVVILTAYGEVGSYLEAMNAGATEYLNKPVKSEELIAVVRSCLRGRPATHEAAP